jgi:uncharacterized membrane protein YgcG
MGRNQDFASAVADPGSRFKQDIVNRFSVRTHMSLIVSGAFSAGLIATTLLHRLGVQSMAVRYPLAVLASCLALFALVRAWIAYVLHVRRESSSSSEPDLDFDVSGGPGLSRSSPFRGGGGSSGGAGASANWDVAEVSGGSSSGGLDNVVDGDVDVDVNIDPEVDIDVDFD